MGPAQGGETHRRPHVVAEVEEGAAKGDGASVKGDAVHDAGHGVLADPEVDEAAGGIVAALNAGVLDVGKVDLKKREIHRKDGDFAVVWARNYGKGRVLYNGLGHAQEVWDRPDIQKMWLEMVQWSMGLVPGDATPRPKPSK